ncbi:DUF421 domain-containing protein [Pseudomonas sp. DC3200b2]|uniref:DUF421 domain-containing protein n=1 Tax=Pseudomonas sp. DC3200b2 TaxID=2804669 RepID=UPI003CFB1BEE
MEWHRFLLGEASPWMLLEICGRAALLYWMLMYGMRLLGRRVVSQYTLFELSIVVTLAGAVGIPLQAQERGLLPPLIILVVLISIQRVVVALSSRNPRFAVAVAGAPELVVNEGTLELAALKHAGLSREKLYGLLRGMRIQHLGQVGRAWLEPSGQLTLVRAERPRPGLCILPEIDEELRRAACIDGACCCASCGHVEPGSATKPCPGCGADRWQPAARELDE